jgi:hypothetical protein
MYLIRDIMYCKPGKVRPMVDKFKALAAVFKKTGVGELRILTDVWAERYWTVVAEIAVRNIDEYAEMSRKTMNDKALQKAMKGYHDLIDQGRREIYQIEG